MLNNFFEKNMFCTIVSFNTNENISIPMIHRTCKLVVKKNVKFEYIGPQLVEMTNMQNSYREEYAGQSSISNKRKAGTMLLEVPSDPAKRLKFLLAEESKLAEGGIGSLILNDSVVSATMRRVLNYSDAYRSLVAESEGVNVDDSFLSLNRTQLENRVSRIANTFVDSIIKFDGVEIHVTSGDIFIHNHFSIDDCAYGLHSSELCSTPKTKVKSMTYLGNTTYYELSVFWVAVEFLVTGGYLLVESQRPILNFGLFHQRLEVWYCNLVSEKIFILYDTNKKTTATPRLLNQYYRRNSYH